MGNKISYAFPPSSLIAHCLHKIARVEAEGIMIVPLGLSSHIQLVHLMLNVPRAQIIRESLEMQGIFLEGWGHHSTFLETWNS